MSTTPPPLPKRARRLRTSRIVLWSCVSGGIAAVLIAAIVLAVVLGGTERRAVRRYLSQTLDDPEFREVQWGRPMSADRAKVLKPHIRGWPKRISPVRQPQLWDDVGRGYTAIRLRYRVRNGVGGWRLKDAVFLIKSGEVRDVVDTEYFWSGR